VARIRTHGPPALTVQCTASGMRGASAAVPRPKGWSPIEVWSMILAVVVDSERDIPATRVAMKLGVYAVAHFAFGPSYEGKNVPEPFQAVVSDRLSRYDYGFHGIVTDDNPNTRLFDDLPEVGDYLVDRMCLIRTEEQVRRGLGRLCREVPLDGMWLNAQDETFIERFARVLPGLAGNA
jgi:hypothetical protein